MCSLIWGCEECVLFGALRSGFSSWAVRSGFSGAFKSLFSSGTVRSGSFSYGLGDVGSLLQG